LRPYILETLSSAVCPVIHNADDPKTKDDFEKNIHILQDTCKKIGIKKEISVEKLLKAKFADNMELL